MPSALTRAYYSLPETPQSGGPWHRQPSHRAVIKGVGESRLLGPPHQVHVVPGFTLHPNASTWPPQLPFIVDAGGDEPMNAPERSEYSGSTGARSPHGLFDRVETQERAQPISPVCIHRAGTQMIAGPDAGLRGEAPALLRATGGDGEAPAVATAVPVGRGRANHLVNHNGGVLARLIPPAETRPLRRSRGPGSCVSAHAVWGNVGVLRVTRGGKREACCDGWVRGGLATSGQACLGGHSYCTYVEMLAACVPLTIGLSTVRRAWTSVKG